MEKKTKKTGKKIKNYLTNSSEKPSDINVLFGGGKRDEGVPDYVAQPESEDGGILSSEHPHEEAGHEAAGHEPEAGKARDPGGLAIV